MLMKGKSYRSEPASGRKAEADPSDVALAVFDRLAADDERMSRFFAVTGLGPQTIREAARSPGFLSAILDHVCSDERLLVEIAGEIGLPPEGVAAAQARLAPQWDPDP